MFLTKIPHFPNLRSGHRIFQRSLPGKQFPSNPLFFQLDQRPAGWHIGFTTDFYA